MNVDANVAIVALVCIVLVAALAFGSRLRGRAKTDYVDASLEINPANNGDDGDALN